jgi:diguanylate cyclase (GGDEF)-like protein
VVSGALLMASIVVCTAIMVGNFRNRALADSERELKNTALILSEQIDRSFQALDIVQSSVVQRIESLKISSNQDFLRQMSSLDIHMMLEDKVNGLIHVDNISLFDSNGNLLNFSHEWPTPTINIADRDYFQRLKSDPQLNPVLSRPLQGRSTGVWSIFLARRVTAPNGEFRGLVTGTIELSYFESFFSSIALGNDSSVTVYRDDGVVLARYPHKEEVIGLPFPPVVDALKGVDNGTIRFKSLFAGKDRILAAHRIAHYPLYVSAALDTEIALADWRDETRVLLGAGGLAAVAIVIMFFLIVRQVEQTHELSRNRLAHLAHYDTLTGLPNRVLFREQLDGSLKWVQRGQKLAVLFLDIDQFKMVNDTLGHPIGDELLKSIALRLRGCLRETDTVARLGGDEFAIIQTSIAGPDDAVDLVTRIQMAVRECCETGGHQLVSDASIGIAIAPNDGTDPDQLLMNADLAMYCAKAEGRGTYRFFKHDMDAGLKARRALESDLRHAVTCGELEVYYQPVVSLRDNTITRFEALARWRHAKRGMISPAEFIPVAEETGLIVPLGECVLRTACLDAAAWPNDIGVAVNISPVQFRSGGLVRMVSEVLAASRLSPQRLELEITEAVLIRDDESALAIINQLRGLGVGIALDDFGTGYSSLSYLQRFPFDTIKIDRSFIKDIAKPEGSRCIVQAIQSIADARNMATVAEGVETEQQRQALRDLGCREMQGFLFSRPIPAAKVTELLLSIHEEAASAA